MNKFVYILVFLAICTVIYEPMVLLPFLNLLPDVVLGFGVMFFIVGFLWFSIWKFICFLRLRSHSRENDRTRTSADVENPTHSN